MIIAAIALQNPDCSFNVLILASLLSGVGGGAFASSMSNCNFFYPRSKQGYALGMNGGLGNLGVSLSQLVAPVSELKMCILPITNFCTHLAPPLRDTDSYG